MHRRLGRVQGKLRGDLERGHASPTDGATSARGAKRIGALDEVLANTPAESRDASQPWLLAPCDLQAVKAAGVTFVESIDV